VESMGPIQDRTREHLGTSDKVIMANRRTLLRAIEQVQQGQLPPLALNAEQAAALTGPDTMDCIAPAQRWDAFWREAAAAKRARAAWLDGGVPEPMAPAPSAASEAHR
jgi:phthalate 4,5-dioxygenase oxygenase subunit